MPPRGIKRCSWLHRRWSVLPINCCPDQSGYDKVDEPESRVRPPEPGRHYAHFLVAEGRDQPDDEEYEARIYCGPGSWAKSWPHGGVGPDEKRPDYEVEEDIDGNLPAAHGSHLVTQAGLEGICVGLHPGGENHPV